MDAFLQFFLQWGYLGLFLGSFIAGSIVPLSSEALVMACVGPMHLDPFKCLWAALAGNVLGGMTCYWLGTLGNIEWIEKYAHVSQEKLAKAQHWVNNGLGAGMAFFAFIPVLGSAITVALGYLRANIPTTVVCMAIGKCLRYAVVIWGTNLLMGLF